MRFAIAGFAMIALACAASAQTPEPPATPDAPPLFRFEGDRMQLVPPPGAPSDRVYTYRFDDRTLQLVPAPDIVERPLPPLAQRDKDGNFLQATPPQKAPPGELCLLAVDRCPQRADVYKGPYRDGTATLYALN